MSSSSPSSSGKRSSGGGSENQGGEGGSGQTGSVERPARTKSVGQYQIFEKRLGRGSFSKVWLGERISDHTPVAVKVIDLRMLQSSKLRANLQKEIEISTELHHPNIMRMYGFHEGTSHVYLFLEYCPGGDLSTTIRKLHSLSEEQCCFWGFQLGEKRPSFGIDVHHGFGIHVFPLSCVTVPHLYLSIPLLLFSLWCGSCAVCFSVCVLSGGKTNHSTVPLTGCRSTVCYMFGLHICVYVREPGLLGVFSCILLVFV